MKTCSVCKETKDFSQFYRRSLSPDGKMPRCKGCDNLARNKWRENNLENAQLSQRGRNLKHKYGITLEEYEAMLLKQNHKCAICGTPDAKTTSKAQNSFCVDHDHVTGEVRGLLCSNCNRGLGLLGDTVEALKKALKYINA